MRPLKIHFSNVNFSSSTGPNTFAHRLATQISYDGYVVADANDYDVALAFIEAGDELQPKKPLVQRLDGIWFKPENFELTNRHIRDTFNRAHHVVFQSEFDSNMVKYWWGPPRAETIIHNGIEIKKRSPPPTFARLRRDFDKVFVCAANWHPQKRLQDVIAMFKHLRTIYPRSCLIVMGSNPDVTVADPGIFYAGSKSHEVCLELYSFADWMIHLAWLDHCPNVVVEALSQGLPVICTDQGGTKEIVGTNGLILTEKQYRWQLTDYDSPPRVDVTQITSLPDVVVDPSHIDIVSVAHKYETIFEGLVK